ncbi:MAG: O-antigen polymerase [Candidatus Falkowbacteria bacterium GW2011_GWC2_38_22]|nr:MAG: O-antigen polymerase [Candidatus Falkowbacteria bacterium GW2011_GWF2_38_1205]KKQ60613.1 MAG: O-antigen polymerase [Candidatus Falkowbacteria bacterium GW2011_GWC2_38_22]KKQ62704.1 MAG: O-antigen polymerase [Candidatus Falkowbacteria bacterium GW2011_GWF1_38_22]KKQ64831.1 MAG: O-antigen polymerase [Candidatus Falkowbacteria bacterium GW2011_GWE2_38_254]KKQ72073.1 MAG: O-antigen polymerase [Candidatus Falkowbacteria bacterium GW2011_GWD2_38_42]HAM88855.1 hypothetical protein [Candidatus
MSQKTYLYILKIGSLLALLPIFFVFKNLLFPFITSKQIPFNILIEVLLIFWAVFIIKYPDYNPFDRPEKKKLITSGLIAFFAVMVISCFTGVDLNLSFWGDIERMLGAFHILHFFGLYLIIITVFRDWRDWKEMLVWSLILSVFLSIKGLTGMEYSTLGNSSYVSGYLIFNIYFALLLFFKEKNSLLRWLYLTPLVFQLPAFYRANTTGAIVGLGFSVLVVFFLYGVLHKNKKLRVATLAVFLLSSILIVYLLNNVNKPLVQDSKFLRGTIGQVTFSKNTFQTRLISWKAAYKDFKTHPFLGVGHGNYAIVFDKYFDPVFLNYTDQETYFDRAHNNVIDIASTTGSIGILAYLSIFIFVLYYLVIAYRKDKISVHEFAMLMGLFTAYFVQNLAVFDSMATYLMLMITLAYVNWLNAEESGHDEYEKETFRGFVRPVGKDESLENKEIYAFLVFGIIMLAVVFQYNIRPWQMLVATIDGQRNWSQGDLLKTYESYKIALKNNSVLDRDSRTSFVRVIISNPSVLSKVDAAKGEEILNFAIKHAEANVEYNKGDSLNQMILAQLYNAAAIFYNGKSDKQAFYMNRALEAIDLSIAASPGRVPTYYQKAQIQITQGNNEGSLETLKYADSLNPEFRDSACYIAKTLLFYKKDAEAFPYIDRCVDKNGTANLAPVSLIKNLINEYLKKEDYARAIKMYSGLTGMEPNNPEYWIKLAALYKQTGDKENAKISAEKAAEVDPKVKGDAERFIEGLGM